MKVDNTLVLHPQRMIQVKNKAKTATLRDGRRSYALGEAVISNSENPQDALLVEITALKIVKFQDIDSSMLEKQGYKTMDDLKKVMKEVYPTITDSSEMTHIEFEVK